MWLSWAMKAPQIFAILTPLLIGLATILVKYLTPATVSEIGTILGLVVTMLVGVRNVFVPAPSQVEQVGMKSRLPNIPGVMIGFVALLALAWTIFLFGCISTAPTVPVTAANQGQVSSCQSIGSAHNDVVVAGLIVGGAAPVLGGVSAGLSDPTAKTDLAISTAVTAGVAGVLTGLSAYTASEFASGQCGQVVGPLPPAPVATAPPATSRFPAPGESVVVVSRAEPVDLHLRGYEPATVRP